HPGHVGGPYAVLRLQHQPRPDIGGDLVFRYADPAASQIIGPRDAAVGADVDRVVAGRPGGKNRHTDTHIGAVAVRRLYREAAHRQFADIEVSMAERAKEDFLGLQQHEHWIDPVDLHAAVDQRAHPVVVADRDGECEPGHAGASLLLPWSVYV